MHGIITHCRKPIIAALYSVDKFRPNLTYCSLKGPPIDFSNLKSSYETYALCVSLFTEKFILNSLTQR